MNEPPTRILVVGSSGAGKSTFARALGRVSGLPVVHLDTVYWRPGWVEPTPEEWSRQLEPILAEPRWILDGNYGGTMKQRARVADVAIFVSRGRGLCVVRVVWRWLRHRRRPRDDRADGCDEQIDWPFIVYTWRYPRVSGPKARRRLAEAGVRVIELRGRTAPGRFLDDWPASAMP